MKNLHFVGVLRKATATEHIRSFNEEKIIQEFKKFNLETHKEQNRFEFLINSKISIDSKV